LAKTADDRFRVELEHGMLSTIDDYCHAAGLLETGGILIGRHCDTNVTVISLEATPPPISSIS
jgi:hypothetical protein